MSTLTLGIDLGGTKIEGVALSTRGRELHRRRVRTPQGDYPATLRALADLVTALNKDCAEDNLPVGIGIPGSLSPLNGTVRNANSTCLNGQALKRDLDQMLGQDVRFANDANCLGLSECFDGAGTGCKTVFAVILGTGVGGALLIGGQLIGGANALAGEWGHVVHPVADAGTDRCYCGQSGCNETVLSGPAIVGAYNKLSSQPVDTVEEVSNLARADDPLAEQILHAHRHNLARALAVVVNIVDPDIFVFGGGVSQLPGLIDALPGAVAPHVFAPEGTDLKTRFTAARWGDASGVRGAARLPRGG